MKKIVRLYLSTFIDVELDSDEFETHSEMIEYARENVSEAIAADPDALNDNLSLDPLDVDVYDAE